MTITVKLQVSIPLFVREDKNVFLRSDTRFTEIIEAFTSDKKNFQHKHGANWANFLIPADDVWLDATATTFPERVLNVNFTAVSWEVFKL